MYTSIFVCIRENLRSIFKSFTINHIWELKTRTCYRKLSLACVTMLKEAYVEENVEDCRQEVRVEN